MINTYQQSSMPSNPKEDQEDASTQAETYFGEEKTSHMQAIVESLPQIAAQIGSHHQIAGKISQGTFTSDKILKLFSAYLKLAKNYRFHSTKGFDKLGCQIGQLRRLLRFDRLLMIFRECAALLRRQKRSTMDKLMLLFKLMMVVGDISDMVAYFIHLRLLPQQKLLPQLRKNVANIYFLECVGWLLYHSYEYSRSKDQQAAFKNKIMIVKYVLDCFTSHNDVTFALFSSNPKLMALLGMVSSAINLSMVWK